MHTYLKLVKLCGIWTQGGGVMAQKPSFRYPLFGPTQFIIVPLSKINYICQTTLQVVDYRGIAWVAYEAFYSKSYTLSKMNYQK
jgi:CDP-diacylglycerol pyrophosphatase